MGTTKERNNYTIFFILTKVTWGKHKILSFSQNKSKVSLSQLNKLSKISAKIICKKTNFIHRYGVLHNNQHLLYWVKMRNQPQIKINNNNNNNNVSLSHHHPLSTILSYNSF